MKAIQRTRSLTTLLRSGLLMAASGVAFALPVHAGEALEIEQPSMRTPSDSHPGDSMARSGVRVPVDSSMPYGTQLPPGEFGDKPEVVGARDESRVPRSHHFQTESHEVTPQWPQQ